MGMTISNMHVHSEHGNHSTHNDNFETIHANDPAKRNEHIDLLSLLPHGEATHVAVNDGSWFDSNTWKDGKVPIAGSKVLIPKGRKVFYDGMSDESIKVIRVDGDLEFAHNKNTKLVVDTLFTDVGSTLTIGSETNPVQADKTTQILIDGSTAIDKNWDPTQISRGVVTHGKVEIYGADKDDFRKLALDAKSGDSQLVLKSAPKGWRVGDQLVLGGTNYDQSGSNADNSKFQDEVLTITAIQGNVIRFTNNDIKSGPNDVLRFDHTRPDGFEDKLNLYVANTTRNVVFETLDADNVPTQQRGHTMFMHNPDVVVQNAGFYSLGRSDKNKLVDDIGSNRDGRPGKGTNPRGRYPLHFHRTGADDINSKPALAKGNAVVDSPGWGITHHDSHAIVEENIVFDVVGTGIAAESGNEIGAWRNNLTIKATGSTLGRPLTRYGPQSARLLNFDMGVQGEGYWVQGAGQVEMENNIAISTAGSAVMLFGGGDGGVEARDVDSIATDLLLPEHRAVALGAETVDTSRVPLRKFSGFEAYNIHEGIFNWARMRDDAGNELHDVYSQIEDFQLWSIRNEGIHTEYSNNVEYIDGLILGNLDDPQGIGLGRNDEAQDIFYKNLRVEGFAEALRVPDEGPKGTTIKSIASGLEDSYFANNLVNLVNIKNGQQKPHPDYFEIVNTTFKSGQSNTDPTASFETSKVGGLGIKFDASSSFDADFAESKKTSNYGIVSYGWDFDADGNIDDFGKQASHYFDRQGTQKVTLTVWDNQGKTDTVTQDIDVRPLRYPNLLVDGNFSAAQSFSKVDRINDWQAGQGWAAKNWVNQRNIGDGAAVVQQGKNSGRLAQVIFDENIRQGAQSLSLDIKNTEGDKKANDIQIRIWGFDGGPGKGALSQSGPRDFGAIPTTSTLLLDKTVGGSSFDWTNFKWNVNFGKGHEFVVFQVNANGTGGNGDFVAVDNVIVSDADGSAPPPAEEPPVEEPPIEEPPAEEPPIEEPPAEEPPVEEPPAEEPPVEEPPAEEPPAEEPAQDYQTVTLKASGDFLDGNSGVQEWGDGVNIYGVAADGSVAEIKYARNGLAVKGGRYNNQVDYDANLKSSEKLVIDFDEPIGQVQLELGLMATNEWNGLNETGLWTAYDKQGNQVASGELDPAKATKLGKSEYEFNIDSSADFVSLSIEATAYGNGADNNRIKNNSDFNLRRITYDAVNVESTEFPVAETPAPAPAAPPASEPIPVAPEATPVPIPIPLPEPKSDTVIPITLTVSGDTFDNKLKAAQEWGDNVKVAAFDVNGNPSRIKYRSTNPAGNPQKEDGIGVNGPDGRIGYQIDYSRQKDASEKMVVDFDSGVSDLTFEVGHLGGTEGPDNTPETGKWTALGKSGQVVGKGLIGPETSINGLISGSYGRYEFLVQADSPVYQLVLEATEFGHGSADISKVGNKNSSEYTLRSVSYIREGKNSDEVDSIIGTGSNSIITGEVISGSPGTDIFALAAGDNTVIITDFEVGIDSISLSEGLSFGAINQTVQGNNLLLSSDGETLAVIEKITTPLGNNSFQQLPD